MRIDALLTQVLLLAAGCGAEDRVGGGQTPSTAPADELEPPATTAGEPQGQRPPAVTLVSAAGSQSAVQGSFCVTGPEVGICADLAEPSAPAELSVVRPGETVQLVLKGVSSAKGSLSVRPLGCDDVLETVPLTGPATSWTVGLAPGSYELELFAAFETASATGDTSGSLGLLVDEDAPLAVVPTRGTEPLPTCGAGYSR
jgi:hypothetical protein